MVKVGGGAIQQTAPPSALQKAYKLLSEFLMQGLYFIKYVVYCNNHK